jgi:O-antigen ligase
MFPRVLQILYPPFLLRPDSEIPHPHNILLSQVVDTGVPGLISLGALLLLLFHMALRSTYLSKRGQWWPLAIGLLGSFVAFVGHGQFDSITSFIRPHTLLWGLIGLQTALWLFLRSQIQASNPGL